jgi:hypothetical protein
LVTVIFKVATGTNPTIGAGVVVVVVVVVVVIIVVVVVVVGLKRVQVPFTKFGEIFVGTIFPAKPSLQRHPLGILVPLLLAGHWAGMHWAFRYPNVSSSCSVLDGGLVLLLK